MQQNCILNFKILSGVTHPKLGIHEAMTPSRT